MGSTKTTIIVTDTMNVYQAEHTLETVKMDGVLMGWSA